MLLLRIRREFETYIVIEGDVEELMKLLEYVVRERGLTDDLEDALRILKNFDVFYGMMRRKFKEYLAPKKNEADLISGRVFVDKVKLYIDKNVKKASIILDRRVDLNSLLDILKKAGLTYEIIN